MMDFKFKLKTKTLWIPVVILIVNFLIIGLVFSRMLVSNSNKTLKKELTELLETEKRQLLTGLSLMTLTQTAGDAMLALEGNDDEIASDIVKQVKPMGLNAVYFTDVSGKVIYPNNAVLPEGFKKELIGSLKVSGETNVSYYGSTMLGYSPIMDVETFAGFLVFQIDIPEEVIAFSQLALKGENLQNENNQNMLVSESILEIYNTANVDHKSFMKKSLLTISLILIPTLIIIIAVLGTTSNRIIRHIHRLLEAFNKQAEGDLTREVVVRSGDEIAELAQAFNHTNMKLNEIMHNIASNSDTISVSAIQLSGTSQNISNDAEEQYSKTIQAANSMQELSVSFIEVAQNAGSAADSAQKADEIATRGGDVVAETIKGMDKISQSVKESSETIEALGERSQEIGEIVKVINDIAGQTNLLALNAAIEAARAGEQGRGFAVVADEVRKLAERTTSATGEIGAMIKGIQEDTGRAVESMHNGTAEVDAGVDLANQAGEALKQILEAVKSVTDVIHQINGAVERQSVASDDITENIDAVANITKQNIDNTKSSSESIVHLNNMASILKELVDGFKLKKDFNDNRSDIVDSRSIPDYSETEPSS